jgi:dTDP-4-amino-4,6-dideoxygalactose transaminase
MNIPFLDLNLHHDAHRLELMGAVNDVIAHNAFAGGPYVESFERDFAPYCDVSEAVGVGSGTEALWLTLLALGIGAGDEVITVSHTFIATAEAISFTGARPVFVDVDPNTCNMDPNLLEAAITSSTKAIMPVHLYGQTADMDPILEIAAKRDIPVVEDASQAHGARYKDRLAGSMGIAGCFSFYPGKNLGAWGEAGAVVTEDLGLAEKIRQLRDHGQPQKYVHDAIGWNARMDGIQGAVLKVKLRHLDEANHDRREAASLYDRALADVEGVILPTEAAGNFHVFHLYVVRVKDRDGLKDILSDKDIGCGIHYPIPLHLQQAYAQLNHTDGDFPVTEQVAATCLSLPMFPELTKSQIEYVAETLKSALKKATQKAVH